VQKKQQGCFERSEFERLLMPHADAIFRSATYLVGPEAAEDVTQEAMLRAWKYFKTFDPETNGRAWLFRVLRNVCNDRWSRPSLELPLADLEEVALEPYYDWEGRFLAEELSSGMQEALRLLPDEYRWAVLLADVEEYSYKQIAAIVNCPIGTVPTCRMLTLPAWRAWLGLGKLRLLPTGGSRDGLQASPRSSRCLPRR